MIVSKYDRTHRYELLEPVLDAETKKPLWEYKLAKGWDTLLSVGHGVVVAKGEGWVYCLDAETGRELWMIPVDGGLTMPAMTKCEVFVGSDDGNLYRIDIKSGEITESYYLGGFVFSPIVANKHVLVGTSENRMYCLGPSNFYRNVIGIIVVTVMVSVFLLFLRKIRAKN